MTHKRQNFEIHSGDKKTLELTITDSDDVILDITGNEIRMKVAPNAYESVVVTKSSTMTTAHVELVNSTAGRVDIVFQSTDTQSLEGVFYYEVELTDGSASEFTVLDGYLTIHRDLIT